jgi:hypothetical protein
MTPAIKFILIVVSALFFQYCAPSRYVKTLERKQRAASFSFGGPLIKFSGAPIPVPFTTLGFGYGATDKVTAYGNLHTTSLLFGNLQADLGATVRLFEKKEQFGVTVSPAVQVAYNLRNRTGFRIWPSLDANIYIHLSKKPSFLYAGLNSWFETSTVRAHGEPQPRNFIPNIHLGYQVVKTKWQHQFELKYLAPGIPNLPGVVEYIGPAGKGSLGIYYGLIRKF